MMEEKSSSFRLRIILLTSSPRSDDDSCTQNDCLNRQLISVTLYRLIIQNLFAKKKKIAMINHDPSRVIHNHWSVASDKTSGNFTIVGSAACQAGGALFFPRIPTRGNNELSKRSIWSLANVL